MWQISSIKKIQGIIQVQEKTKGTVKCKMSFEVQINYLKQFQWNLCKGKNIKKEGKKA